MTDDIREKAIEAAARAIHDCWNLQAGWIPWVEDSPPKWHASWQEKARREARAAIAAWEAALWRPVSEAPKGVAVIVAGDGEVGEATQDAEGVWFVEDAFYAPTHFRPLPAPPEDAK